MADQQPTQSSLASTFPDPPPFWQDFTPEKISRIEELRKAAGAGVDAGATVARIPDVPGDLVNLQPPAEPQDGRWRCFGDLYTLKDELPSLEEQGIERLIPGGPEHEQQAQPSSVTDGPHTDRALVLKRLAKSLLLNFLELTGVLGANPGQAEEKIGDIRTILINVHHALNEYRPHQARQSLIDLMQGQLDRTRAETAAVRAATDKARSVLEGLGSIDVPAGGVPPAAAAMAAGGLAGKELEEAALRAEREKWAAIDAEFA
ncbi:Mediator of RNA polymerase II transcription subunit 7 [Pleurostoma richardsiae]|uniref:Mediator of RNA polymerase II transcription subunit 7 n=1 Tax=Pleurostoma richardsiae TaxID=41990 RepID=A0AA38VSW2_9PEZI|nr:Mediator of RNA polymerase II transcription subunit 7 [Pleurostoma richardsiae]